MKRKNLYVHVVSPYTVPRATLESVDENIFDSLYHRDAIIPSCNGVSGHYHSVRVADMNAISVGAGFRGNQLQFSQSYVCTFGNEYVKAFGVHSSNTLYNHVAAIAEEKALHSRIQHDRHMRLSNQIYDYYIAMREHIVRLMIYVDEMRYCLRLDS